jgi:beta-galactosidase
MRTVTSINSDWLFHPGFSPESVSHLQAGESVCLPHNAVDVPLNYFDATCYQREFTYQKVLRWSPEFAGREVMLVFDAAMADALVWVNGIQVAAHPDGYTPFTARLTECLRPGENVITVRISGAENPAIPPFGGRIDYLTYAGLYRDVWLHVTAPVSIARLKVESIDTLAPAKTIHVHCTLANPTGQVVAGSLSARLSDAAGHVLARVTMPATSTTATLTLPAVTGLRLWDVDDPVLYQVSVELQTSTGRDEVSTSCGFRTAEFTPGGFVLNGRPLKLRGLNRHQSWPYVGYALGRRAQEFDAELLKRFLKCNIVRTSHYPQSPWFLDHCDRIGLLVFEEIPGWQHLGDRNWQQEAVRNVRRMIERDWNHPSIVLWGVRINESDDAHDLYAETNRLARTLDPTRQTGGVRCIPRSEFLEDVYTMNDFIQGQEETPGHAAPPKVLRDPQAVTGLPQAVPYLVTEFNGHMYPTKRYDQEQRQAEHVSRHLRVLNAMYGHPGIAGCIGWCLADYNTHKDFGSGDRICHHGVLDMFREPKFAAYAYASQGDPAEEIVLKPVTYWARGERNIGGTLPLIVLTNCEEVEMQHGAITKRLGPDRTAYPHLPHAPVIFEPRHFTADELGAWGAEWLDVTFVGYIGGRAVKTVSMVAAPRPATLEAAADRSVLKANEKDSVRVVARGLDQAGQILPFIEDIVAIKVAGPARLLGPDILPFNAGRIGFWLETTGRRGTVSVTLSSGRFPEKKLTLEVE